ncbi:MAG: response regulator transcription factor [Prolixibacteraceae bacterium]|mgnify:FL=1|jgi:two-component system, LytTR family, response regulator|nr:response regulator transcription factor [Prolixibacteraceae bacterium]MBT6005957.1 response regulator transcription factor [Prolixibacteraceae bacterium]MBT6764707.1 response regulator transcription factor [Prolixibacteraceae bacterium]MBT6999108.1 response regulator transcription factor [Prolixibacteraceae bacterium]MBT7393635.1 response regulator transcription factor [Prolixibacteraceae bacterium]
MFEHKLTTVIIDNNIAELKKLSTRLNKTAKFSIVGKSTTGKHGISLIHNFTPQLVFINVDLIDINGLEFVKILRSRNIFTQIVFVADNDKYAFDSLQLEPFDYLIKPIRKDHIQQILERIEFKLEKEELIRKVDLYAKSHSISTKRILKQKKGIIILLLEEIVFCKAELTITLLILKNGKKVRLKTGLNETLKTINSKDFIKISRSYCINSNYLHKIEIDNNKCILYSEGNTWEVPASKCAIKRLEKFITNT